MPPTIPTNNLFDWCFIVPEQLGISTPPLNPARPPNYDPIWTTTQGIGPARTYLDIGGRRGQVAYPPRPMAGSTADLDILFDHCDFGVDKVRLRFH